MGRKPTVNFNLPKGMRARKQRSGRIYYYYDTGTNSRKEIALGSDYALAVKKWAEIEIAAVPIFARATFKDVSDRYLREIVPGKATKTQHGNIRELEKLLEFFGNPPAPLEDIEPIHIRQHLDWRKNAPVAANREKALFSHIWNKAREWGYTALANPCQGIRGKSEKGRSIYIEDSIFQAVYTHADQALRDAMDMAYLTGQRPADVLSMADQDIRDGELFVQQGKTGAKLRITIEGALKILIERINTRKATFFVRAERLIVNEEGRPLTKGALRSRFDLAREEAIKHVPDMSEAIKSFQFRDLRAKAGTDKAELSGDIRQAQKQLGHASIAMTEQYVRQRKGDKVGPTK